MSVTRARLLEVLGYDPITGAFTWRIKPRPVKMGSAPGRYNKGYLEISIDDHRYLAHRLAWLYVYGEWPKGEIDHANGDPADNRIANLRKATRSQNASNGRTRSDNLSGLKGVSWHEPTQKWASRIQTNGRRRSLGYFYTAEQAHLAYRMAAAGDHGEFARSR